VGEMERPIFPHHCEDKLCHATVIFDDEPKCFVHSLASGPRFPGYSASKKAKEKREKTEESQEKQAL
jgi:hypothetical protein